MDYDNSSSRLFILSTMAVLCFFVLTMGLFFCLVPSPHNKAETLVNISQHYRQQSQQVHLKSETEDYLVNLSRSYLLRAAQANPYNITIWDGLSENFHSSQQAELALRVQKISYALQAKEIYEPFDLTLLSYPEK